jgi:DNA-binding MarR family transcriptional regulator
MTEPTEPIETTGRRIGLLRVAFDQALAAILEQVSPRHPDLRPAHVQIFRYGGIDGSNAAELAAHAGMTKQSMHELVTHLERAGYLQRRPDPGDTRVRTVRLTAKGRKLERELHDAIATVLESWERQVGKRRFDQLWATLQDLTGEHGLLPAPADIRGAPSRTSDGRTARR